LPSATFVRSICSPALRFSLALVCGTTRWLSLCEDRRLGVFARGGSLWCLGRRPSKLFRWKINGSLLYLDDLLGGTMWICSRMPCSYVEKSMTNLDCPVLPSDPLVLKQKKTRFQSMLFNNFWCRSLLQKIGR